MIDELSSSWSGVHADTYRESLYGLIYGNGEADSLAYKNAFIKWYTEGIGDLKHRTGRKYEPEEETE